MAPLTLILGAVPKVPETFCTETPADLPSRERLISPSPLMFTSTAESLSVAPVNILLSVVVIPVTTASESISVLSSRVKSTFAAAGFTTSLNPRQVASSCEPAGTLSNCQFPSMSVTVALFPPFTETTTPGRGFPEASFTVPDDLRFCAQMRVAEKAVRIIVAIILFIFIQSVLWSM